MYFVKLFTLSKKWLTILLLYIFDVQKKIWDKPVRAVIHRLFGFVRNFLNCHVFQTNLKQITSPLDIKSLCSFSSPNPNKNIKFIPRRTASQDSGVGMKWILQCFSREKVPWTKNKIVLFCFVLGYLNIFFYCRLSIHHKSMDNPD